MYVLLSSNDEHVNPHNILLREHDIIVAVTNRMQKVPKLRFVLRRTEDGIHLHNNRNEFLYDVSHLVRHDIAKPFTATDYGIVEHLHPDNVDRLPDYRIYRTRKEQCSRVGKIRVEHKQRPYKDAWLGRSVVECLITDPDQRYDELLDWFKCIGLTVNEGGIICEQ